MWSSKYEPLKQTACEHLSEHERTRRIDKMSLERAWKTVYVLCTLLGIFLLSNVLFFRQLRNIQDLLDTQSYVGLQRNISLPILHDDRTIDDPMWDSPEIDYFTGFLALSDEFVSKKGLPSAMRYPWDHSKGIYVLHSYHSLHCVFVLRQAIMEWHDNEEQSWLYSHVTHCLHVLREDTTCNADDTPRYTGRLHEEANVTTISSGVGQTRMCRDWSKLRRFAIENSACYRRPLDHSIPLLERYKFCPDGSKPWESEE